MRNKKEVLSDKPQIFRTMLSVIAALLVYEAGKAAGLILAGLLFGYGGSPGVKNAGTVNSGLTGGMANLLMTLTGGLACLAVWRSSLNFRLGKKPGWKWIPPFILLAAALSLGLNIVIAYLGLAQHSQTFQQVAKEQAAVPLWLGICLYGFAAPFSEELVFRGIIYGKSKEVFGAPLPWYFPAWFSAFTTGTWCRGFMLPCLESCLPGWQNGPALFWLPLFFMG